MDAEVSSGAEGYTDPNPTNNRLTGQIFAAVDANGNTTLYSYTEDDYLESVTNGQASVEYDYDTADRLKTITNGDAVYSFDYNAFGATKSISVGDTVISTNNYRDGNGKLLSTAFAGTELSYTYDELNRVSQKSYTNGDTVSYKYDGNGNLVQRNQTGGVEWDFVYDNAGTLVGAARDDIYQAKYKYDAAGRLTALMRTADGQNRYTGFAYNKYEQATNVKITGGSAEINEANTFDSLGRLEKKQWSQGENQAFAAYTYKEGAGETGATSTQLDTVEFGSGSETVSTGRKYLYDNNGNIVQEQHLINGNYTGKIWYTYDAASQLIRVDDAVNNQTVQYTYDDQGNIIRRTVHAYTTGTPGTATRTDTWTYGGADGNTLLTSAIDGVTTSYNYPHYGLPDSWTGNRTLTWRNGRTLASIGNTSFTYDGEGQRISKTTNGVTTEYIYEGDKLVMQKQGNASLFFLYDTSGIFGFDLIENGTTTDTYYYRTDGKGEIIALTDAACNVVASYTYDAWGTPTAITDASGNAITSSTHIGIVNPIRYKGYCFDTETGLYYLNSRYYDPEICRFINADDIGLLGVNRDFANLNLYVYCGNNPSIRKDIIGYAWETIWDALSLASSVVEVVANPYDPWAWIGLAGDAADVLIPFVGGIGETTRALKAASQAAEMLDTATDVKKGWKVGEDITSLTKAGNKPNWSTLRSRYWKNKAHYFASEYSKENVDRMMRGLAPQFVEEGQQYTMELHHILGREGDNFYFFFEITPKGHAQVDPFRFMKL